MTTTPVEQADLPPFTNHNPRCVRCGNRRLEAEVVERRFKEHQDLGDCIEWERVELGGKLAQLDNGRGAPGGDGG